MIVSILKASCYIKNVKYINVFINLIVHGQFFITCPSHFVRNDKEGYLLIIIIHDSPALPFQFLLSLGLLLLD